MSPQSLCNPSYNGIKACGCYSSRGCRDASGCVWVGVRNKTIQKGLSLSISYVRRIYNEIEGGLYAEGWGRGQHTR